DVTTAADPNDDPTKLSLREAILQANADPTVTMIQVHQNQVGPQINVTAPLPAVTAPKLVIFGDFCYLDGTNVGQADGLVLKGDGITVSSLGIRNFGDA